MDKWIWNNQVTEPMEITMKQYAKYERYKRRLNKLDLTPGEYVAAVQRLTELLDI